MQGARWSKVAGAAALLLVGCFGRGHFDGAVYRGGDHHFALGALPDGWRRVDGPALLTFRDDSRDASIAVDGRCGNDGDDVPLASLTHHLFLQFEDRVIVSQSERTMDGRAAMLTELEANLDGVRKRFVVVVMKRDGCVYDFILVEPPPGSRGCLAEFEALLDGFRSVR